MVANSDITPVLDSVQTRMKSTHIKCLDMHFSHSKQHFLDFLRQNDAFMYFLGSMFNNSLGSFMISNSDITAVVDSVETVIKSIHF
jgi:hypothetical protein